MKRQDNRQILVMLATSFLILCVLHPYPGHIRMGLKSLVCLLLFSALMFLIEDRVENLCDLVLGGALCFAGFVFTNLISRRLVDDVSPDTFSSNDAVLPFRFQLPPPTLFA